MEYGKIIDSDSVLLQQPERNCCCSSISYFESESELHTGCSVRLHCGNYRKEKSRTNHVFNEFIKHSNFLYVSINHVSSSGEGSIAKVGLYVLKKKQIFLDTMTK